MYVGPKDLPLRASRLTSRWCGLREANMANPDLVSYAGSADLVS
ncbi:hypothetical protein [Saccharopolyspora pogona]|nr:hypothetical protein [Saccharopolyspora pogona]